LGRVFLRTFTVIDTTALPCVTVSYTTVGYWVRKTSILRTLVELFLRVRIFDGN